MLEKRLSVSVFFSGKEGEASHLSPDSLNIKSKRMTSEELKKVAELISAQTIFTTKEVLTTEEAAAYMGMRKSYLYKLTMNKKIPHYKPMGKVVYFQRKELEAWLLSNRVATDEELSEKAQDYCTRKGGIK